MSKLYAGLSVLKDGSFSFEDALLYYTDTPPAYFIIKILMDRKKETKMVKIKNQITLDLRNYTPEALSRIKTIKNAINILLPENPSPEFSEAYAKIKKINVINETTIPGDACMFNGTANLTKNELSEGNIIICNGSAILRDIPKELNIKVKVNGNLIKSPSANVEILKVNGSTFEIDDDANLILSIAEMNIDSAFIKNAKEKTAIINCGKVFICDELTDDELSDRNIKFYGVGQIVAKKELHGYIQNNSYNVGLIQTYEEAERRDKKYAKKMFWWK